MRERLTGEGRFGETEELLVRIGARRISRADLRRHPDEPGRDRAPRRRSASRARDRGPFATDAVEALIADGNTPENRAAARRADPRAPGRADHRRSRPRRDAGGDARRDAPLRRGGGRRRTPMNGTSPTPISRSTVIEKLAELGVFGLTIPEEFGGMGLGKESMCVVSEELSRGYIGVGSLGTRSEIAAELILGGGTEAQKAKWLPKIASGEILPTAVFTEPNTGSDLASLQHPRGARRRRLQDHRQQDLDHPSRPRRPDDAARPHQPGRARLSRASRCCSPRSRAAPTRIRSRSQGMTGGEIEVLGYRGMKEYELAFDGFEVPGREPARRRRGPGLQAAHADLRIRPHPDRRARRRRRAVRARSRPALCARSASSSASR